MREETIDGPNTQDFEQPILAMKPYSLLVICFASCLFAASTMAQSDLATKLRSALRETDDAHVAVARRITDATPEARKALLAAIVQIVEDAVRVPQPRDFNANNMITQSAYVLAAVADDEATLAAFGTNLLQLESSIDSDALLALSSCRGSRAVEIMAEYARFQLNKIKQYAPRIPAIEESGTDEQRRMAGEPIKAVLYALMGLAKSRNSAGKVVARQLRDDFLKLFEGTRIREEILRTLAKEVDPLFREQSQPVGTPARASVTAGRSLPKNTHEARPEASVPLNEPVQKHGASRIVMAIAAGIGGVIVLGILIRFLRRK